MEGNDWEQVQFSGVPTRTEGVAVQPTVPHVWQFSSVCSFSRQAWRRVCGVQLADHHVTPPAPLEIDGLIT
jgi:hypothetical protein